VSPVLTALFRISPQPRVRVNVSVVLGLATLGYSWIRPSVLTWCCGIQCSDCFIIKMQDIKTEARVLPPAASCSDEVKSETHTVHPAVGTDAASPGEISVEAVASRPSDVCQPLTTEAVAESGIGLHGSVEIGDGIPAANMEVLSPSSSAITSAVSTDLGVADEISVEALVLGPSANCQPLPAEAQSEVSVDDTPVADVEVLSSSSDALTTAVSTDAQAADEASVKTVAPSPSADCQLLPTEAQSEINVDNCDGIPAEDTQVLSSLSNAFTSAVSTDAQAAGEASGGAVAPNLSDDFQPLPTEAQSEVSIDDTSAADTAVLSSSSIAFTSAVRTDAGAPGEFSVEAVAPSPSADRQPLPTEAQSEVIPAAATEGLSASSHAFTAAADAEKNGHVDADELADNRCRDAAILHDDTEVRVCSDDVASSSDAVSAVSAEVTSLEVSTASAVSVCDAEVIPPTDATSSADSRQPSVVTVTHDVTSPLNLGSILAESFVSTTHSAAGVISTQATIGSPVVVGETAASTTTGSALVAHEASVSSDLITPAFGGSVCFALLCRSLQC